MSESAERRPVTNCNFCGWSVIEIEYYGERLVGCVDCNRWSWDGSERDRLFMELPEEDIEALRGDKAKAKVSVQGPQWALSVPQPHATPAADDKPLPQTAKASPDDIGP